MFSNHFYGTPEDPLSGIIKLENRIKNDITHTEKFLEYIKARVAVELDYAKHLSSMKSKLVDLDEERTTCMSLLEYQKVFL